MTYTEVLSAYKKNIIDDKITNSVQIMEYLDNCHLISCEGLPQKKKKLHLDF